MVAMIAGTRYREKVPVKTRNSETNGARPGSDSPDRPATRNVPARIGATFWTPP
jgi:hypothetical protein